MYKTRKASETPLEDIAKISYEGQPETSKQYEFGFEQEFNLLPIMDNDNIDNTLGITQNVMNIISKRLQTIVNEPSLPMIGKTFPNDNEFHRTIIAMESPKAEYNKLYHDDNDEPTGYKEGAELVVAKWGTGFKSPIHGHSTGYMHEEIIKGKIKVDTFRLLDNGSVIPYKTEIIGKGVFVSGYVPHDKNQKHKRQTLIHSFTALEPTISLHYLPEHTRDGRDNGFTIDNYTDFLILNEPEVTRITSKEGMYLTPGEVVLVRSSNVPEYGDHFIVVTGPPIMKEHGLRIQDISIPASLNDAEFLDMFELETGLILLKLNIEARNNFLKFHGITIENNQVLFPQI